MDVFLVEHICQSLPLFYVEYLLNYLSEQIHQSAHFAFYLSWIYALLMHHTNNLKPNSTKILSSLCNLEKNLTLKQEHLGKMSVHSISSIGFIRLLRSSVENNIYTIDYLSTIAQLPRQVEEMDTSSSSSSSAEKRKHLSEE